MRRFNRVLAVASIAAVSLSGCGGNDDDDRPQPQTQQVQTQPQEQSYDEYTPTCVNPETQEVLPLDYCERGDGDDDNDFLMTYVLMSAMMNNGSTTHVYPSVGQTLPKDTYVTSKPVNGKQVDSKTFTERNKSYVAKQKSAPVQKAQAPAKPKNKADQAPAPAQKAEKKKSSFWGSSKSSSSGAGKTKSFGGGGFKSSTRRK